jgi:hypothetical protein
MSPGAQILKSEHDALGTAENESGVQNMKTGPDDLGTAPKTSPGAKNKKTVHDAPGTAEKEFGTQNIKTGPDALEIAEDESERAKQENVTRRPRYRRNRVRARKTGKRDPTPSILPKMSSGAQNMKMGPDALGTAENNTRCAKHEKGPDAHGTAENKSGSTKFENGTRRPWYRRKRIRVRKKSNGT